MAEKGLYMIGTIFRFLLLLLIKLITRIFYHFEIEWISGKLKSYKDQKVFLEQIQEGAYFKLETGRVFIKGKKLRSWYQCFEQPNNKEYRVSGISKVEIIEKIN